MAYTTIKKPSDYFNTVLYTGDGTNGQNITGVGFQPDLCWIKDRSAAQEHMWYDAVRGNDKLLRSNNIAGDATTSTTTYFTSFDSDGFTVGSESALGGSGANLVGWNWLGANGTTANTDGTISSTVSTNTTSGFSIVSFTGTGSASTIGHGLNAVPKMYIVKNRSTADLQWRVYHASLGATKFMCLDATQVVGTSTSIFNDTEPTSSVFSVGTDDAANKSGDNLIAYCFADVQGYSKFGSHVGNGSADGTFIYTGFKPAFVIIKKTNGAGSWWVDDNKRDSFNPTLKALQANAAVAEVADGAGDLDFLSNGFKCRDNTDAINILGGSYIYMAFAEEPLVGDNPATAR